MLFPSQIQKLTSLLSLMAHLRDLLHYYIVITFQTDAVPQSDTEADVPPVIDGSPEGFVTLLHCYYIVITFQTDAVPESDTEADLPPVIDGSPEGLHGANDRNRKQRGHQFL